MIPTFSHPYPRLSFPATLCLVLASFSLAGVFQPAYASGPHQKMISIYNIYEGAVPVKVEQPIVAPEPQPEPVQFTAHYTLTSYTSLAALTDSSPFITASGSRVHMGTVAANCLPFGTRIQIPELYGDAIFVVEDRLHPRKGCGMIDVWLPTYAEAKKFGVKHAEVEILAMK